MKTKTSIKNPSTATAREHYSIGSVTSQDGTTISYRQLGYGPGVVLLHGAMESAQSHMQLAEALADTFTVYVPDRRGRGLSGPYGKDYSIQEDVEDMDALLTKQAPTMSSGLAQAPLSGSKRHSPYPPFTKPLSSNRRCPSTAPRRLPS